VLELEAAAVAALVLEVEVDEAVVLVEPGLAVVPPEPPLEVEVSVLAVVLLEPPPEAELAVLVVLGSVVGAGHAGVIASHLALAISFHAA
jgi:hypothetical protein